MGKLKITSIKLPPDVIKELDEIAKKHGMNRSELCRFILGQFISKYYEKRKRRKVRVVG